MVDATLPIEAIAMGAQVENRRASYSSPAGTARITYASRQQCELLITPRNSSFSCANESASSISSVGLAASITLNIAAGVMLAVGSGRGTRRPIVRNRCSCRTASSAMSA